MFLTAEEANPSVAIILTWTVRVHASWLRRSCGKVGACHLLRHCMATPHARELEPTSATSSRSSAMRTSRPRKIYTHVAIRVLQQVYAATSSHGVHRERQSAPRRRSARPTRPSLTYSRRLIVTLTKTARNGRFLPLPACCFWPAPMSAGVLATFTTAAKEELLSSFVPVVCRRRCICAFESGAKKCIRGSRPKILHCTRASRKTGLTPQLH